MIYIILLLLGLALGSFTNALVWRIYKQDFSKDKRAQKKEHRAKKLKTQNSPLKTRDLSILRGRSMCIHCHHTLAWHDLLPVFSWLNLKGKCRYCQKQIHWLYPVVELTTATLFIASYAFWPFLLLTPFSLLLFTIWLICLVLLIALLVFDAKWQLLPDRLVFPLIGLSAIFATLRIAQPSNYPVTLVDILLSIVIAGGLFYALFVLSKGKWIGGGDGKLGVALGLLLATPSLALLMLFLASILGTVYALPSYLKSRKNSRVPFGPFLITATFICFFFGHNIVNWYLGIIGL